MQNTLFDDDEVITSFQGEYRFLSNFYPVDIEFEGITYPSVEHAYQASKTSDTKLRTAVLSMTPGQAKRFGRTVKITRAWDACRLHTMTRLVRIKFQDESLRAQLLMTGDRQLIEGNDWGDTYWGQCPIGTGKNWLGRILMVVRSEIKWNEKAWQISDLQLDRDVVE